MREEHSAPPANWMSNATKLADKLYYRLLVDPIHLTFFHRCAPAEPWYRHLLSYPDHAVVQEEPLQVEPSLHFDCCGLHGQVREGRWEDQRREPDAPDPHRR